MGSSWLLRGFIALALLGSLVPAATESSAQAAGSGISFRYSNVYRMVSEARSVAVGDFTGDGLQDAVVATTVDQTSDPWRGKHELVLYQQGPVGVFGVAQRLPLESGHELGISTGDVNADGLLDVVVATYSVSVFHQRPTGGLVPGPVLQDIDQADHVDVADVDRDGWGDIAVQTREGLFFLRNEGGTYIQTPLSPIQMSDVGFADVTGDRLLDIVSPGRGQIHVFEQQPGQTFLPTAIHTARWRGETQPATPTIWSFGVGDVTGDGRSDVVAALDDMGSTDSTTLNVFVQGADGGLGEPKLRPVGTTPWHMTIADVDRDRRNDLLIAHSLPEPALGVMRGTSGGLDRERLARARFRDSWWIAAARLGGRTMAIVSAASTTGVVVLRNPVRPRPLVSSGLREIVPSLESGYLGFSRARRGRPRFTDAYVRTPGGRVKKINRRGTQGWAGNVDRGRLVYQEATRRDSDIVFYDLSSGRRRSVPGARDRHWQWGPTLSGRYLLFGEIDRGAELIKLGELRSGYSRELDYDYSRAELTPGQVNGDHAVWTVCKRICNVRTYRISKYDHGSVPNPRKLTQYAGSVASDGTVFFARSGYGCGKNVRIMMRPRGGRAQVVGHLPPGIDLLASYVGTDRRGREVLTFDRVVCRTWQWDIYGL